MMIDIIQALLNMMKSLEERVSFLEQEYNEEMNNLLLSLPKDSYDSST